MVSTLDLVVAVLHFAPLLVWGTLAHDTWRRFRGARRPPGEIFRLFPVLFGLAAAFYLVLMIEAFTKMGVPDPDMSPVHPLIAVLALLIVAAIAPVVRHLMASTPSSFASDERLGGSWLAVNYGSGVVVGAGAVTAFLWGDPPLPRAWSPSDTSSAPTCSSWWRSPSWGHAGKWVGGRCGPARCGGASTTRTTSRRDSSPR